MTWGGGAALAWGAGRAAPGSAPKRDQAPARRKGDVLMVTRIGRLARSIGDLQDIVRAVRAKGASLKATEQPIDTAPQQASASSTWLFDTHISGRIGLPTVAGSSRRCRSSNTRCRPVIPVTPCSRRFGVPAGGRRSLTQTDPTSIFRIRAFITTAAK
jgi:hypothetical protein